MKASAVFVCCLQEEQAEYAVRDEKNTDLLASLRPRYIGRMGTRHEQHPTFALANCARLAGRAGIANAERGGMPLLPIAGQKARRANRSDRARRNDVRAPGV